MSELRVALTFDAEHPSRRQCPPGAIEHIIAILREHDLQATFFVQGRWATAYPQAARSIADGGHLVGNHSHSHAPMTDLSDRGLITDIDDAEASIRDILGVDPRPWFRCPFGAGFDDGRVLDALASRGYRNIHWDVAVEDWADYRQARDVEGDSLKGVLHYGDGAILLLHTWPAPTVAALPGIIEHLQAKGARFVTVDEVINGR